MNWFKENPAALVLLVLAIIGTGATSYLAVDATARRDEAQAALDSADTEVETISESKAVPDRAKSQAREGKHGAIP
jgi:uncharacterized protein involved in exopolysaccharide biosynthesis